MFKRSHAHAVETLAALDKSLATIEFDTSGKILAANANFCAAMGYVLDEIVGQHHRMWVDADYSASPKYAAFWRKLNVGEFVAAEFKRFGKRGREVWIQVPYNPIFDYNRNITKVVKFATVVTGRVHAVNEIAQGLEHLAQNDPTYRIADAVDPQFSKVRDDFNTAMSVLDEAMGVVAHATQSVGAGARQISTASKDLAQRTEQQAANLERPPPCPASRPARAPISRPSSSNLAVKTDEWTEF